MKTLITRWEQLQQRPSIQIARDLFHSVDVNMEAAALTYYILLCIVPILLVIANLIPLLPLPVEAILQSLNMILPDRINDVVMPVLMGYLNQVNSSVISIGAIALIWSASRALNSLQKTLNRVYDAPVRRNVIFSRLFSFLSTVIAIVVVAVLSFVFVFGRNVIHLVEEWFGIDILVMVPDFSLLRWALFVGGTFLLMCWVYFAIPNVRWRIREAVPGSVLTTVGFVLISQLFTLYVEYAGRNLSANGTFGGLLIFMVWLYSACFVVILGGMLNVWLHRVRE